MDPTAALNQIRALIKQIEEAETLAHKNLLREEALDTFETLDQWLSFGGFLPDAWEDIDIRKAKV